jgi:hypothetical protein
MYELLTTQYNEVKGARHALFAYCRSIEGEDLLKKLLLLMTTA